MSASGSRVKFKKGSIVTKYTTVQGREPELVSDDVYPWAILNYDKKKNVCVITLYQLGENGERVGLSTITIHRRI